MIISRIILKNWRNFKEADVPLRSRMFVVGPNASGKSNFLDAFRFLRDLVKDGGGFQQAIKERGGLTRIRFIPARNQNNVEIEVELSERNAFMPAWRYALSFNQGKNDERPRIIHEKVWKRGVSTHNVIYKNGENGDGRHYTLIQQPNASEGFREIAHHFSRIQYLHVVPQLLRYPHQFPGPEFSDDPFGRKFLDQVASTPEMIRRRRFKMLQDALKLAVPQLSKLAFETDKKTGLPHLSAVYKHWRPTGAKQTEEQFSDGTLRLIGILWSLLDSNSMLLLEEPELSLNGAIVERLPELIYKTQEESGRQAIISTHSHDLLSDKGIAGEEILALYPSETGTVAEIVVKRKEIRALLRAGMTPAEAILPTIRPENITQLSLFGDGADRR